jgi:hypothetical protein
MLTERSLQLGEQPRQLDSRMIFGPDRSVLYISVPKTGCTTIKMIVAASIGLLNPRMLEHPTRGGIHNIWNNRNLRWSNLIDSKRRALLTSDATFRFTSIRNPFERVVSCYLNKIVNNDGSFYLSSQLHDQGNVSLQKFLEFVREQPALKRDVHYRAMTDLCFSGRVSYDDIIRYESFESDLRRIMARLNVSTLNIPTPSASNKTEAGSQMHALVGLRERDLIREIYRGDFEEFGYSMDLPTFE